MANNEFEDKFPSLKGKKIDTGCKHCESIAYAIADCEFSNEDYIPDFAIKLKDIEKNCLDKQRVRRAINDFLLGAIKKDRLRERLDL